MVFLYHLRLQLHPVSSDADVLDGWVGDVSDGELSRVTVQRVAMGVGAKVLRYSVGKLDWGDFNHVLDSVEQNPH